MGHKLCVLGFLCNLNPIFSAFFLFEAQEIVHKNQAKNFYNFHKLFLQKSLTNTRFYVRIVGHVKWVWV